jgi:ABC-type antimicrobial peptide transport system ATPase subunit
MFDEGVVIEEGPPKKIFTRAEHERTRRFLSQLHWGEGAFVEGEKKGAR